MIDLVLRIDEAVYVIQPPLVKPVATGLGRNADLAIWPPSTMKGMEQPRSQFVSLSGSRGSVTLPADVRRRYHLDEPGAQVEVISRSDGVIELHPVLPHRVDQAWFWTDRWQAMEREVDEDVAAGRVETFASAEDFIADLDREAADRGLR